MIALAIVDALLEADDFDPKGWSQDNLPFLHPKIKTTFSTVKWSDDADGDPDAYSEEHGYEDEEGEEMQVDDFDREEGVNVAQKAIHWLRHAGATEPSSSQFHPGVWYSSEPSQDYRTGASTTRSYHLEDFRPEEEREIYYALTGREYRHPNF
jgi:hypothetical protein